MLFQSKSKQFVSEAWVWFKRGCPILIPIRVSPKRESGDCVLFFSPLHNSETNPILIPSNLYPILGGAVQEQGIGHFPAAHSILV